MRKRLTTLIMVLAVAMTLVVPIGSFSALAASDGTPPVVTSVETDSKTTVKPGESFSVTVYATDSSGIDTERSCVTFQWEADADSDMLYYTNRYFEKKGENEYVATFDVNEWDKNGVYSIRYIDLYDTAGNTIRMFDGVFSDYPDLFPKVEFTVTGARSDVEGPTVTEIKLDEQTVKAGDTITITVHATDESGVLGQYVNARFRYVKSANNKEVSATFKETKDLGNDNYACVFEVPDDWPNGEYQLSYFSIDDIEHNYTYIRDAETNKYRELLPESKITMTDSSAPAFDETPPTVTKIVAESQTLKVGDTFTVTVFATDEGGFDDSYFGIVYLSIDPDDPKWETASASDYMNFSKDASLENNGNGSFSATFVVGENWIEGKYVINQVSITDKEWNYTDLNRSVDTLIPDAVFTLGADTAPSESPEPSETIKPSETPAPSETVKPSETPAPSETVKPSETPAPSETVKPSDTPTPSESAKPSESPKPSESTKPSESPKPTESTKPSESPKPTESTKPSESPKPSDHQSICPSRHLTDMKGTEQEWFHNGIDYVITKGYMTGVENNQFVPNRAVPRATVVQTLYAMESKPEVKRSSGLKDIKVGKWYTDAVNWAASTGVVAGYPDGTFKPDKAVTREELATILYKYAKTKTDVSNISTNALNKFRDKNSVHNYAKTPVSWAVTNKIISGTDIGLEPLGTATRAQFAVMLQAFDKK